MPKPGKRSASGEALGVYNRKRDFTRTREPKGARRASGPVLEYVIQKHEATRLHYDLRLELDGVMKSWAVPKGPSLDPSVKRLAVEVEDHPMDYNRFEGTIPKGEYGGGTVMIWDRGSYQPYGESDDPVAGIRAGLKRGELKFTLKGVRLKGSWVLVRTRRQGAKNQWLLIKYQDRYARSGSEATERFLKSVASKRSMAQIAKAG
jgi:bifunctional non-homologous end joining protein LigD